MDLQPGGRTAVVTGATRGLWPDEIADVTTFLLSARAGWITGTDVVVDGGQNAPGMAGC